MASLDGTESPLFDNVRLWPNKDIFSARFYTSGVLWSIDMFSLYASGVWFGEGTAPMMEFCFLLVFLVLTLAYELLTELSVFDCFLSWYNFEYELATLGFLTATFGVLYNEL